MQAFPVAPLFFLGTIAAYLFFGPFAIYYALFRANTKSYYQEPSTLFFVVGVAVTILGALFIRWLVVTLTREQWFRHV